MFDRKYSDTQRLAMLQLADSGLSIRKVSAVLAAEGYPSLDVKPFDVPEPSARKIVATLRKRAAGETFSPLAAKAEDYAVEELRKRIVTILDRETVRLAGRQTSGQLDLERLRKCAQIVRELRQSAPRAKGPTKGPEPNAPERDEFMQGLADDQTEPDDGTGEPTPPTSTTDTGGGGEVDGPGLAGLRTADNATTQAEPEPVPSTHADREPPSPTPIGHYVAPS